MFSQKKMLYQVRENINIRNLVSKCITVKTGVNNMGEVYLMLIIIWITKFT